MILGPLLGLLAGMFEFANQTGYNLFHLCRVRVFFAALYSLVYCETTLS